MSDEQLESWETHNERVARMRGVLHETHDDLVAVTLAELLGEPDRHLVDRLYRRLESMSSRDLALAVVIAALDKANYRANRLWSALQTMTPEDVK